MSNFQSIRRGPFGGDQYTQIHNHVFRAASGLSMHAMAVLGHISTHREGWGTSARTIGREFGVSESTIRRALQELKRRHYVVQGQERRSDGAMGDTWLFVTDLPAQLEAVGITDPDLVERRVAEALAEWLEEQRETAGQNRQSPVAGGLTSINTPVESDAG